MGRATRIALFSTAALLAANAIALAEDVSVPMDEVRLVAFKEPVTTVYMGNPVIADVTMIDAQHAFLLGKTFGETNLIALGSNGKQISNEHVVVFGRRVGAVTLNRGAQTYNYTCTAQHCETQPVPGDPSDYFANTHSAIDTHEGQGAKAAVGTAAH
jgi:Pilus formation protein N terminal region